MEKIVPKLHRYRTVRPPRMSYGNFRILTLTRHSCQPAAFRHPIDHRGGADRSHARSARGSKSLPTKSSRSPAGPNSRASRAQLRPVIGLGQRTGRDADRSHGAIRPLLDIWALKSSTLERNSFKIDDLFALL